MRILIAKSESEQLRWGQALSGSTIEPVFVDPWDLQLKSDSDELRTLWMNLDEFHGVIVVSPSAAHVLVNMLDEFWPMPPVGIQYLCNGEATARVLNAAGLNVAFPHQGHTAEDVLQLPEASIEPQQKWLVVKGDGGRVTYKTVLEQRGGKVSEAVVYHRRLKTDAVGQMFAAASHCEALMLSSQYLGEQLMAQDAARWLNWPGLWWLSSQRLADWAAQQGISNIRVCHGATPAALKQAYDSANEGL